MEKLVSLLGCLAILTIWLSPSTLAEKGIINKTLSLDGDGDKEYWEARESEPGEVTLSEEGRKRLELTFEDYEQGKHQVFENVEDLMKDLNE